MLFQTIGGVPTNFYKVSSTEKAVSTSHGTGVKYCTINTSKKHCYMQQINMCNTLEYTDVMRNIVYNVSIHSVV